MTKKKSSFGRIIFILILLFILVAGGIFGYKYYADANNRVDEIPSLISNLDKEPEIEFPIAGIWYLDNPQLSSEYIFDSPGNKEGKIIGKLDIFVDKVSTAVLDYEIIGENKLKISDSKNAVEPYELTYIHYPNEQKLEIISGEEKRTYLRTSPAEAKAEAEKIQTQLWMDNIADIEWKEFDMTDQYTRVVKFNKPVQEGDIIKGEFEWSTDNETYIYKYERVSDGEVAFTPIKYLINGVETENYGGSGSLKMQLLDNGNILILENPAYRTWKFRR